jgi:hypothetical protein
MRAMAAWLVAAQEPGSAQRAAAEAEAVYAWAGSAAGCEDLQRRPAGADGGEGSGGEAAHSWGGRCGGRWVRVPALASEPAAGAAAAGAEARLSAAVVAA